LYCSEEPPPDALFWSAATHVNSAALRTMILRNMQADPAGRVNGNRDIFRPQLVEISVAASRD
jgi:hypothetical protein